MSVKLIAITRPTGKVYYDGVYTPAHLVAYMARVSNPANQTSGEYEKLLKYLMKHQHWSPFEMVNAVLEIVTTRDVARQILRHRSFSFQEFSQRYAEVGDGDALMCDARFQDEKNRQNSIPLNKDFWAINEDWEYEQAAAWARARDAYNWAIKKGIAKEVARKVLPEGLTLSKLYMNGTLRSWLHYCNLRMGNGTQFDHQAIASKCWHVLAKELPEVFSAETTANV